MASSNEQTPQVNLATLLLTKRKMTVKNTDKSNRQQTSTSISVDINTASMSPTTKTNSPKTSRQTERQLEVKLLDKKMKEINRKQEVNTNETINKWRGFDSFNYGFVSKSELQKSNIDLPVSSTQPPIKAERQSSPTKIQDKTDNETRSEESLVAPLSIKKHSSPISEQSIVERINSPVEDHRLISELSPTKEGTQMEYSPQQDNIDKQPKTLNLEHNKIESELSQSSMPIIENKTPILSTISHLQTSEQSSLPISIDHNFKNLPNIQHHEIKRTRKTYQTIQRSMELYRFHVW